MQPKRTCDCVCYKVNQTWCCAAGCRQRYKKSPSFLSLHMGVKAEVLAGEHDCHHIVLESWDKMEAARWGSTFPAECCCRCVQVIGTGAPGRLGQRCWLVYVLRVQSTGVGAGKSRIAAAGPTRTPLHTPTCKRSRSSALS